MHEPWKLSIQLQKEYGVVIGETYPKPIACQKYTGGAGLGPKLYNQELGFTDEKTEEAPRPKRQKGNRGKNKHHKQ